MLPSSDVCNADFSSWFLMNKNTCKARRRWDKMEKAAPIRTIAEDKESVPARYEEYLLLLQERNRLLKKLRKKNAKQAALEQREQGFSLYVNGANMKSCFQCQPATIPCLSSERAQRAKTAGGHWVHLTLRELQHLKDTCHYYQTDCRNKTAPEKLKRKTWKAGSIMIQTAHGNKMKIEAKSDSESDSESSNSGKKQKTRSDSSSSSSSETERNKEDNSSSNKDESSSEEQELISHMQSGLEKHTDESDVDSPSIDINQDEEEEEEEEVYPKEQVLLSMKDVKVLRQSLESNKNIRRRRRRRSCDTNQESTDSEIEENLEEELTTNSRNSTLKPHDTIILEFGPIKKKERPLSAVKKINDEAVEFPVKREVAARELEPVVTCLAQSNTVHLQTDIKRVSRPLSANRKLENELLDLVADKKAVFKAIQAENETAKKKIPMKKIVTSLDVKNLQLLKANMNSVIKDESHCSMNTAIKDESHCSMNAIIKDESHCSMNAIIKDESHCSMNAVIKDMFARSHKDDINDKTIAHVVERVHDLEPRQQRRLLKALEQLEQSTRNLILQDDTIEVKCVGNPIKLDIAMQILSNWGHTNRVGLTEVQFFDTSGQQVPVDSHGVSVHGSEEASGEITNLINGKFKTCKEQNMWSCHFRANRILMISFTLSLDESLQLGKIKIWNYNKSVRELSVGVKNIRIWLCGHIIFDGEIIKGCGNQVFDFSTDISLSLNKQEDKEKMSSSPPVYRTQTRTLSQTSLEELPVVTKKKQEASKEVPLNISPKLDDTSIFNTSLPELLPLTGSEDAFPSHSMMDSLASSIFNDEQRAPAEIQDLSLSHQPDSWSESSLKLLNCLEKNELKPSWLKKAEMKELLGKPLPRWAQSEQTIPIIIEEPKIDTLCPLLEDSSRPLARYGRRSRTTTPDDDDDDDDDCEDTQLISRRDEKENLKALENDSFLLAPQKSNEKMSRRNKFGDHLWPNVKLNIGTEQELNLEESWSSLNKFKQLQRGRISTSIEGDILDMYLIEEDHLSSSSDNDSSSSDCDFFIPELPNGREMSINILSTWGDRHYVGLTAIDIFSSTGDHVIPVKIIADPADINILPEYSKDPRVVTNLFDGVNRTRDDMHLWLTPFTKGKNHLIYLTFDKVVTIAMIRIWNYNKSRIHSFRGAKDVEITLDSKVIFKGEIAQASGSTKGDIENFGDAILFTTDDVVLEAISHNDELYSENLGDDNPEDDLPEQRPPTGDKEQRPFTSAFEKIDTHHQVEEVAIPVPGCGKDNSGQAFYGQTLTLNFTATWGDNHFLGLTGLEVVGIDGEELPIHPSMVNACPKDMRVLEGYENDDRTIDNLVDTIYITNSQQHMWMIPFSDGDDHLITITFWQPVYMVALRIWNYNKSTEDSYMGAKIMHVSLDRKKISPPEGFLLRKGPGNCHFDFAQEINFFGLPPGVSSALLHNDLTPIRSKKSSQLLPDEDYVAPPRLCGFIYQFQLLSTYGDPYYVGLNGLQLYDDQGKVIPLNVNNIAAYPDSVNVLDNVCNDVRTPDKLIDGINDTNDGSHMWLAPLLPGIINRVYVIFDYPMTVSLIKIWNYSKTPARGVREFGLLVDDLLVYNGVLSQVYPVARGILPTCCSVPYHTILFTENKEILKREKHTIVNNISEQDQEIQLMNDHCIVKHFTHSNSVNQALRPRTSVTERSNSRMERLFPR